MTVVSSCCTTALDVFFFALLLDPAELATMAVLVSTAALSAIAAFSLLLLHTVHFDRALFAVSTLYPGISSSAASAKKSHDGTLVFLLYLVNNSSMSISVSAAAVLADSVR
jgi:hypothetical protein